MRALLALEPPLKHRSRGKTAPPCALFGKSLHVRVLAPSTSRVLARESFDAVVVDDDLEEGGDGLRRWLKAKYRGVVVFTGEPQAAEAPGPASAEVTRRVLVAMRERRRATKPNLRGNFEEGAPRRGS